MTVGEKIQFYRKEQGLSQEELGKKLLVSRQTISLWENDQTVPTIDNLIRLKEIFGISVDDILGVSEETQAVEQPKEEYRLSFTKDEVMKICKAEQSKLIRKIVLVVLLSSVSLVVAYESSSAVSGYLLAGVSATCVFLLLNHLVKFRKAWKKNAEKVSSSDYEYRVYDAYLSVIVRNRGEKVREFKYKFDDIENMTQIDDYITMQIGGGLFLLRKSSLKENSVLNNHMSKMSQKKDLKVPRNKWRIISIVSLIASMFSPLIAFLVSSEVYHHFYESITQEHLWVFFLFLPIPIASIVIGFIMKNKGYVYLKNIIVGVVVVFWLCAYGAFSVLGEVPFGTDESFNVIGITEQTLNIDIPEHKNSSTQDWTIGEQTTQGGYMHYISRIEFDDDNARKFEKQMQNDARWLSVVPNKLHGMTLPQMDIQTCDYVMIYNCDTDEFNIPLKEQGKYCCLTLVYCAELNELHIFEYDIEYR